MAKLQRMADLISIASALERRDPTSKLARAVKNAGRVQSCIADLTLAQSTLEALAQLRGLGKWGPAQHRTAAEHALLANAVFLYARATATSAKAVERGHTSVRDRLDQNLQTKHDRVVAVRNVALAHVRANEPIVDELWHREFVFAVEQESGGWLPAAMTRRVQVNPSLERDLRQLLPQGIRLLRETYHRRIDYVSNAINETPDTMKLFETHLLDPIAIFGTDQEARKALTGNRPGGRTFGVIEG